MTNFLCSLFFSISPFVRFRVFGNSMYPTFVEGEDVLVQKEWFFCSVKMNDCFVVKDPRTGRLLLKRIKRIEGNRIFVIGDNEKESTDSRHFGWIKVKDTIGKVISS